MTRGMWHVARGDFFLGSGVILLVLALVGARLAVGVGILGNSPPHP